MNEDGNPVCVNSSLQEMMSKVVNLCVPSSDASHSQNNNSDKYQQVSDQLCQNQEICMPQGVEVAQIFQSSGDEIVAGKQGVSSVSTKFFTPPTTTDYLTTDVHLTPVTEQLPNSLTDCKGVGKQECSGSESQSIQETSSTGGRPVKYCDFIVLQDTQSVLQSTGQDSQPDQQIQTRTPNTSRDLQEIGTQKQVPSSSQANLVEEADINLPQPSAIQTKNFSNAKSLQQLGLKINTADLENILHIAETNSQQQDNVVGDKGAHHGMLECGTSVDAGNQRQGNATMETWQNNSRNAQSSGISFGLQAKDQKAENDEDGFQPTQQQQDQDELQLYMSQPQDDTDLVQQTSSAQAFQNEHQQQEFMELIETKYQPTQPQQNQSQQQQKNPDSCTNTEKESEQIQTDTEYPLILTNSTNLSEVFHIYKSQQLNGDVDLSLSQQHQQLQQDLRDSPSLNIHYNPLYSADLENVKLASNMVILQSQENSEIKSQSIDKSNQNGENEDQLLQPANFIPESQEQETWQQNDNSQKNVDAGDFISNNASDENNVQVDIVADENNNQQSKSDKLEVVNGSDEEADKDDGLRNIRCQRSDEESEDNEDTEDWFSQKNQFPLDEDAINDGIENNDDVAKNNNNKVKQFLGINTGGLKLWDVNGQMMKESGMRDVQMTLLVDQAMEKRKQQDKIQKKKELELMQKLLEEEERKQHEKQNKSVLKKSQDVVDTIKVVGKLQQVKQKQRVGNTAVNQKQIMFQKGGQLDAAQSIRVEEDRGNEAAPTQENTSAEQQEQVVPAEFGFAQIVAPKSFSVGSNDAISSLMLAAQRSLPPFQLTAPPQPQILQPVEQVQQKQNEEANGKHDPPIFYGYSSDGEDPVVLQQDDNLIMKHVLQTRDKLLAEFNKRKRQSPDAQNSSPDQLNPKEIPQNEQQLQDGYVESFDTFQMAESKGYYGFVDNLDRLQKEEAAGDYNKRIKLQRLNQLLDGNNNKIIEDQQQNATKNDDQQQVLNQKLDNTDDHKDKKCSDLSQLYCFSITTTNEKNNRKKMGARQAIQKGEQINYTKKKQLIQRFKNKKQFIKCSKLVKQIENLVGQVNNSCEQNLEKTKQCVISVNNNEVSQHRNPDIQHIVKNNNKHVCEQDVNIADVSDFINQVSMNSPQYCKNPSSGSLKKCRVSWTKFGRHWMMTSYNLKMRRQLKRQCKSLIQKTNQHGDNQNELINRMLQKKKIEKIIDNKASSQKNQVSSFFDDDFSLKKLNDVQVANVKKSVTQCQQPKVVQDQIQSQKYDKIGQNIAVIKNRSNNGKIDNYFSFEKIKAKLSQKQKKNIEENICIQQKAQVEKCGQQKCDGFCVSQYNSDKIKQKDDKLKVKKQLKRRSYILANNQSWVKIGRRWMGPLL